MANGIPFESVYSIKGVLLGPFLLIGLTLFLLGFYVLLFGLTIYSLKARSRVVHRKLHLAWTVILFLLSIAAALCNMAEVIKEAVLGFQAAVSQDMGPLWNWVGTNGSHTIFELFIVLLYILANCVADAILLYRYFILWDLRWRACVIPALALLATNATGMAGNLMYYVPLLSISKTKQDIPTLGFNFMTAYYILNATNSFVLSLIIGRIWWLSRDSRRLLGRDKYNNIVTIIIESGFMYSACLVIHTSVRQSESTIGFPLDTSPLVYLMVGIAPTLIILRTSLGLAVPSSQVLSSLRFGDALQTANIERSEVHTVDLQRPANDSGDLEAQKHETASEIAANTGA